MTRSHQKLAPDYPIFKVTILAAVPTIVTPIDKQRRAHLLDFFDWREKSGHGAYISTDFDWVPSDWSKEMSQCIAM